jgi:hypothetical protein
MPPAVQKPHRSTPRQIESNTQIPPLPPTPPLPRAELTPEQIKAIKESTNDTKAEEKLQRTQDLLEERAKRELAGLDIPFDVEKLITEGIIEKRGLELVKGKIWGDMHSLSTPEEIVAKLLVDKLLGDQENRRKASGIDIMEIQAKASLAMGITRLNDRSFEFPIDLMEIENRETTDFKKCFDDKLELLVILIRFPVRWTNDMIVIHRGLEYLDKLEAQGEETQKKS